MSDRVTGEDYDGWVMACCRAGVDYEGDGPGDLGYGVELALLRALDITPEQLADACARLEAGE